MVAVVSFVVIVCWYGFQGGGSRVKNAFQSQKSPGNNSLKQSLVRNPYAVCIFWTSLTCIQGQQPRVFSNDRIRIVLLDFTKKLLYRCNGPPVILLAFRCLTTSISSQVLYSVLSRARAFRRPFSTIVVIHTQPRFYPISPGSFSSFSISIASRNRMHSKLVLAFSTKVNVSSHQNLNSRVSIFHHLCFGCAWQILCFWSGASAKGKLSDELRFFEFLCTHLISV